MDRDLARVMVVGTIVGQRWLLRRVEPQWREREPLGQRIDEDLDRRACELLLALAHAFEVLDRLNVHLAHALLVADLVELYRFAIEPILSIEKLVTLSPRLGLNERIEVVSTNECMNE